MASWTTLYFKPAAPKGTCIVSTDEQQLIFLTAVNIKEPWACKPVGVAWAKIVDGMNHLPRATFAYTMQDKNAEPTFQRLLTNFNVAQAKKASVTGTDDEAALFPVQPPPSFR